MYPIFYAHLILWHTNFVFLNYVKRDLDDSKSILEDMKKLIRPESESDDEEMITDAPILVIVPEED